MKKLMLYGLLVPLIFQLHAKQIDDCKSEVTPNNANLIETFDKEEAYLKKMSPKTKKLIKKYEDRKNNADEEIERIKEIYKIQANIEFDYNESDKLYRHIKGCLNHWNICVKEISRENRKKQQLILQELLREDPKHRNYYLEQLNHLEGGR